MNLAIRIEYARLLWISKQRRIAWTVAAVATSHGVWKAMKLPHEETKETTLRYECSANDMALIFKIAERGVEMAAEHKVTIDKMLAAQDIATVHCNGRPLKLWQFLAGDASDFAHDFTAIGRFLDRRAGVLTGGIVLRFEEVRQ